MMTTTSFANTLKRTSDFQMLNRAIPLKSMQQWNPFKNVVWPIIKKPITRREVQKAIASSLFFSIPLEITDENYSRTISRRDHIKRIAYLAVHQWTDPIQIDVGIPELGCHVDWIIMDGNHRLAAAFYRKEKTILADISGSIETAKKWLETGDFY